MSSHLLSDSMNKLVRPLALMPDTQMILGSGWEIAVPSWLIDGGEAKWRYVEQAALSFGFNALVIGALWRQRLTGTKEMSDSFRKCLQFFSRSSLKLFLTPEGQPGSHIRSMKTILEDLKLQEVTPVWISRVLDPRFQESLLDKCVVDAFESEISNIQSYFSEGSWVLSISFLHPFLNLFASTWIEALDRMLPKNALISFSATASSPFTDFEKLHPFLEKLKKHSIDRYPRFLPMINAGSIGYGEGLWPALSWDLFHKMHLLQRTKALAGWISCTRHVPDAKSLLGAQLQVIGSLQMSQSFPEECLEIWAEKEGFRLTSDSMEFLRKTRELSLKATLIKQQAEITSLSSDYFLNQGEEILAGVKLLKKWDGLIDSQWQKAAVIFARDIRRFVWHALSLKQLSFTHLLTQDDQENGFWTALSNSPRLGSPYPKVQFLQQPDYLNLDTHQKKLMQTSWSEDNHSKQ